MGGNAVKTIVLAMVLVVLSLLVGTQVSDGLKDSVGAFVVIACVVLGFLLLFMGQNAWWLIFLLPPVLNVLDIKALQGSLGTYTVAGMILFYNLVQGVFLRQHKLLWHKLPLFDILFGVIILYMCVSYYRHPVFLEMMGDDVEVVGATPYIVSLGAVVYYFSLSILPVKSRDVEKILRIAFWMMIVFEIGRVIFRYQRGDIYWSAYESSDSGGGEMGFGERRILLLCPLSEALLPYCYASLPFLSLLKSPLRLIGILFSLYGISLAGARGIFLYTMTTLVGIAWMKREIAALCLIGTVAWGGCLVLGSNGALEYAPATVQRMLSILPGVKVNDRVAREAQASSDVRVVAWKMAFDTRAGYIRDYMWGDGFQLFRKEHDRTMIAIMRGTAIGIGQGRGNDVLARTGMWHNYFITTLHRLGAVGCVLIYLMMLVGLCLYLVLGRYYYGKSFFAYFCALTGDTFITPFTFFYSAGTPTGFFASFKTLILLKLLYSILRAEGKLGPIVLQRSYVPMLIQEQSAAGAVGGRPALMP